VDVADAAAVAAVAEAILAEAGRVDILVNNAGITRDGLLMRMSEADWDAVLDTNLKGAFSFTKAFSRAFLKQRSGRILNISSVIGLIGNAGQCNYSASKAGLIGFTRSVAREFASRGVTVNALAPGFIETDMTAVLTPERKADIARRIRWGGWGSRGHRPGRLVPGGTGGRLHHRPGADGGRGPGNVENGAAGKKALAPPE
jgi:3-oxoacyl-[acyl-carrier protein] reductase